MAEDGIIGFGFFKGGRDSNNLFIADDAAVRHAFAELVRNESFPALKHANLGNATSAVQEAALLKADHGPLFDDFVEGTDFFLL